MEVLAAYENSSGQVNNKTKSAFYLHESTQESVVNKVQRVTGFGRKEFPFIYLGCPIFYTRRKMEFYDGLITKVMNKLQSWKAKALFCKLWWNFRTKPSLWSSFMSQKYCKKLNPIVVPWKQGSHVWRKLIECRDIIEHQIGWHPKMGSALFWYENWTGLGALYFSVPPDFGIDETINNVSDVVDEGTWNVKKLTGILPEEYATHILEKVKPPGDQAVLDRPFWSLETRGNFTVKSAWEYLRRRKDPGNAYKKLWIKGLPFKISFFMWKVWRAKLPLDDSMKKLGYHMPSKC
ncbi:uncharacterized protein [Nicotiana tomentosiformis]|uniref:uncharacterized protein n=1 Tax=Nicotiana tomentosiformis TaxID=4098 RepID=UPI00388CDD03